LEKQDKPVFDWWKARIKKGKKEKFRTVETAQNGNVLVLTGKCEVR
jgi:hypothetical protein